ncbi:hypothetical protein [Draconibacterium orientale]|uniref:hypothetical protein n=1 Tax=Draconibacterium orientale TaxID=1168034 RepID=UPI002A0A226A|nr:hypothetical protein [Draconibacterium orientale]
MKPTILKLSLFALLLLFAGVGCEDDDPPCACGLENPQENLEWLNHILQKSFCTEVYSIQYLGQEYIGVYDCPTGADYGWVIYDCDGNKFCEYQGFTGKYTCEDIGSEEFLTALNNRELIYTQETNPYWEENE